jgi:hypothetical protein
MIVDEFHKVIKKEKFEQFLDLGIPINWFLTATMTRFEFQHSSIFEKKGFFYFGNSDGPDIVFTPDKKHRIGYYGNRSIFFLKFTNLISL